VVVLWFALAQVLVTTESEAAATRKSDQEHDRLFYAMRGVLRRVFGFEYKNEYLCIGECYEYDVLGEGLEGLMKNWNALPSYWHRVLAPPLCIIVFVLVDLPAWLFGALFLAVHKAARRARRRDYVAVGKGGAEPFVAGTRAAVAMWSLVMMPFGVLVLILVELGTLLLSPVTPVRQPFGSSYENLKRFLEPLLESLPQSLVQLTYLIWGAVALGRSFDWLIVTSLLTSLVQLSHTYHYVKELSRAYRKGFGGILVELLLLTSRRYVPFRLVLRSWEVVDYRAVPGLLTNEMWIQIGDALLGNHALKRLRFASHHLSKATNLAALCPALQVNRHLKELSVFRGKEEAADVKCEFPDELVSVLAAPTALRTLRVEGLKILPAQWLAILQAMGTSAQLEEMHLDANKVLGTKESAKVPNESSPKNESSPNESSPNDSSPNDLSPSSAQLAQLRTVGIRALLSVRSLRALSLRRVPADMLAALFEGGLAESSSIVRADLSYNGISPLRSMVWFAGSAVAGCAHSCLMASPSPTGPPKGPPSKPLLPSSFSTHRALLALRWKCCF